MKTYITILLIITLTVSTTGYYLGKNLGLKDIECPSGLEVAIGQFVEKDILLVCYKIEK